MNPRRAMVRPCRAPRFMAPRPGAAGSPRGFTLMEVGVALLLAALLVGVAIPGVQSVTAARLREAAGQIAGMSREAYARAAISGKVHRVVMDLDKNTFHLEATSSRFVLQKERSQQLTEQEAKDRAAGIKTERSSRGGRSRILATSDSDLDESERLQRDLEAEANWVPADDELGSPRPLPADCGYEKVWIAHQSEAFIRGQAELYFWPSGHSEAAIIRLTDDLENAGRVITVKINGLTGRAQVLDRAVEIPQ